MEQTTINEAYRKGYMNGKCAAEKNMQFLLLEAIGALRSGDCKARVAVEMKGFGFYAVIENGKLIDWKLDV